VSDHAAGGPSHLLDGVRVLDFTQYLAGPSCTRMLVELGAEVIKVESPPAGDPTRVLTPQRHGISGIFMQQNRGKRSVCLDLRRPEAVAAVKRLVPLVDVVIENSTPGVMERRGLGWADLSAINPRVILASVSGFGQSGPYRDRSCFDFIAQGMSGLMHMTGEPDGPPFFVGVGLGDTNAGIHAFASIGFALYQRDRTGRGTHIDVSMVEALYHMQENAIAATSLTNGEYQAIRQGLNYQVTSPAGTFKGPEGWIVVLCMPNQIDGLWSALERPDLADDERFATYDARIANRAELTALIEAWMASFDSDDEVLDVLARHHVPSGPVLSPAQTLTHPLFLERGAVRQITDHAGGTFWAPAFPVCFDGERPQADLVPPLLGEHTREVLASAGLDDAEIDDLIRTAGIDCATRADSPST
jgi:crotonobetainyl-CoA:carnitine CoA-transferase CaiB-like acyl-CoA transferase